MKEIEFYAVIETIWAIIVLVFQAQSNTSFNLNICKYKSTTNDKRPQTKEEKFESDFPKLKMRQTKCSLLLDQIKKLNTYIIYYQIIKTFLLTMWPSGLVLCRRLELI